MPATNGLSTIVAGRPTALAPLETLSYARLAAPEPDAAEVHKLAAAAQSPGFFYLDLSEAPDGGRWPEAVGPLYDLAAAYFREPQPVKMKDFIEGIEKGYKSEVDSETLELRRDELLAAAGSGAPSQSPVPAALAPHADRLTAFVRTAHSVAQTLLARLLGASALAGCGVGGRAAIERAHADAARSASGLKLESMPLCARLEDVPPSEHTDGGTLTLLWCNDYTTEVRMPPADESRGTMDADWRFVQPRANCVIVNVADSLQRASGDRLMSCLHRCGQPAAVEKASEQERVCVLYYLRPGKEL